MNTKKLTIQEYKELLKLDRIKIGQEEEKEVKYCYKPYRTLHNY